MPELKDMAVGERPFAASLRAAAAGAADALGDCDEPTPTGWTIAEAFYAVLYLSVTCDNKVTREEREQAVALVQGSRLLQSLSPERLSEIKRKVAERVRYETGVLKPVCATLRKDMRLPTFAKALDIILSDGEITQDEADFLNTLMLRFELVGEQVGRVAKVIALKNRF